MRLELTGRHFEVTPQLRRLVESKLTRLERLLNDQALSAQTVLTRERGRARVDITLHARGETFLHGFGFATAWEPAIGGAIEKITQQALKVKGRRNARKRRTVPAETVVGRAEPAVLARGATPRSNGKVVKTRMPRIVRTDRQPIKPMTLADAARELDVARDAVVVFRDRETEAISVLYRRRGELTLVKTEA